MYNIKRISRPFVSLSGPLEFVPFFFALKAVFVHGEKSCARIRDSSIIKVSLNKFQRKIARVLTQKESSGELVRFCS